MCLYSVTFESGSAKQLARVCGLAALLRAVDSYCSRDGADQMATACVFDLDTSCHISFDQRGELPYLQSETLTPQPHVHFRLNVLSAFHHSYKAELWR